MKLHNLTPSEGSNKSGKRIGRGQGSGRGGTSTRGHKGAKSRSGYKSKAGFEGGQMPLYRRIPKFGFKNPFRTEYAPVNIGTLNKLAEEKGITEFSPEILYQNGLIGKKDLVKILAKGELSKTITVSAHKISASAQTAIEQAGGSFTAIS